MIIDARTLSPGHPVEANICIVGAGAAGITLARELAGINRNVCLVESGGLNLDLPTQNLYRGKSIGWPYWPLEASRVRFFGGTTNHWGGACIPLDEIDFRVRDWVPESGWPISYAAMVPFYETAQKVFGLGAFNYNSAALQNIGHQVLEFPGRGVRTRMSQSAAIKRFGLHYRPEIENSPNLVTFLFANAVNIHTDETGNHVTQLECACLSGTRFRVKAKVFVLAMGGIENARMLLVSRKAQKHGLGNQNDLVGRYFSDHYYFARLGSIIIPDPKTNLDFYLRPQSEGEARPHAHFALSPETQEREKLLQVRIHVRAADWSRHASTLEPSPSSRLLREIASILRGFGHAEDPPQRTASDYGEPEGARLLHFGAWSEVIPRHESRVMLSDDRDELGLQRVVLDWHMGLEEKDSLIRSARIFAEHLGSAGYGRARVDIRENSGWPWPKGGTPGLHQMGTTRMSENPKRGVVDENCRVHGMHNLYVAGSSVFPTYGVANPTLTVIALALRLADHIKIHG